jgi:hypothetical protein
LIRLLWQTYDVFGGLGVARAVTVGGELELPEGTGVVDEMLASIDGLAKWICCDKDAARHLEDFPLAQERDDGVCVFERGRAVRYAF